jgi:hypothetical protein
VALALPSWPWPSSLTPSVTTRWLSAINQRFKREVVAGFERDRFST